MASVSKLVRDEVAARLLAAWRTKLTTIASTYDTTDRELQDLLDIDWTGNRPQFFQGQVGVESLENTSTVKYPLVILYAESATHDGTEKFRTFSGSAAMNLEFHYTWGKSKALPKFDELMDLIEETVVLVFHDRTWVGALSAGLSYRGEITFTRGPVTEGAENWLQTLGARIVFGVDV